MTGRAFGARRVRLFSEIVALLPERIFQFEACLGDCAALPSNLIEAELFGHERGSFTGAVERRVAKFEQAEGGTIFLDEIGELPLDLQVKFLRVLQEREIEPVGGKKKKVNVRVVAATNRVLEDEMAAGRFRMG